VRGYYAAGDGGGGTFRWNSGDGSADNGGTILQLSAGGGGRWNRIYDTSVNVRWFGAKGDGATDDTAFIQTCIDAVGLSACTAGVVASAYSRGGTVIFPRGVYKTTAPLYVPAFVTLEGAGSQAFNFDIGVTNPTGTVIYYTDATVGNAAIRIVPFLVSTGVRFSGNSGFPTGANIGSTYSEVRKAGIRNLTVGTLTNHQFGILMLGAIGCMLDNVLSYGFKQGIYYQAGWGANFSNVYVNAATVDGIYLGANTNALSIVSGYIDMTAAAGSVGLHTYGTYGLSTYGLTIEHAESLSFFDNTLGVVMSESWNEGGAVATVCKVNDSYKIRYVGGYVYCPVGVLHANTTGANVSMERITFPGGGYAKVFGTISAFTDFNGQGFDLSGTDAAVSTYANTCRIVIQPDDKTVKYGGTNHVVSRYVAGSGNQYTEYFFFNGVFSYSVESVATGTVIKDLNGNERIRFTPAAGGGSILLSGVCTILTGFGTPEGSVVANVGSIYMRTNGGAATSLYVKETGVGNTGWVGK
jgi:hypothetical protein